MRIPLTTRTAKENAVDLPKSNSVDDLVALRTRHHRNDVVVHFPVGGFGTSGNGRNHGGTMPVFDGGTERIGVIRMHL